LVDDELAIDLVGGVTGEHLDDVGLQAEHVGLPLLVSASSVASGVRFV
jgi:hypothetical protein